MNEPETNLEIAAEPTTRLEEEIQSLRTLLVCTLLALLVISGALNIFMFKQASLVWFQMVEQQRAVEQYNSVTYPALRDLWKDTLEYSRNHPDFKSNVVNKYAPLLGIPGQPAAAPKK